jgi:hypothetical protein
MSGLMYKKWSTSEEAVLVQLHRAGWEEARIALELGRSAGAVKSRLNRLTLWLDGHEMVQVPGESALDCVRCGERYGGDAITSVVGPLGPERTDRYMHGDCYLLACSIHDVTGGWDNGGWERVQVA